MSRIHVLKTWPAPFEAMRAGRKTFEYRLNDRGFEVGDRLVLQEYNPEFDNLTGEALTRRVVYVLDGGKFGVPPKYCVLGVEPEEAGLMPGAASPAEMRSCKRCWFYPCPEHTTEEKTVPRWAQDVLAGPGSGAVCKLCKGSGIHEWDIPDADGDTHGAPCPHGCSPKGSNR